VGVYQKLEFLPQENHLLVFKDFFGNNKLDYQLLIQDVGHQTRQSTGQTTCQPFSVVGIGCAYGEHPSSNDTKLVSRTQVSKVAFGISERSWSRAICHAHSGWILEPFMIALSHWVWVEQWSCCNRF
jgi:hypothetical protein